MSFFNQIAYLLLGLVAVIYSSAGFGGGSSYLSIMALMNLSYQVYPTLALICNLIVVTGSVIRFIQNKMINWEKNFSWIVLSIPFAFLGGLIHLSEKTFLILLSLLLFCSGVRIIMNNLIISHHEKIQSYNPNSIQRISIGGLLGLVSGLVGIGGGIFLSPIMTYWKMDKAKNIAIATTVFIFVNSISALAAKLHDGKHFLQILNYWPILLIVFIGGQIGNRWCVYKATDRQLTLVTGVLAILASLTLVFKIF